MDDVFITIIQSSVFSRHEGMNNFLMTIIYFRRLAIPQADLLKGLRYDHLQANRNQAPPGQG